MTFPPSLTDTNRLVTIALTIVLAVMGGWVISEARDYKRKHRTSMVLGGLMLIVMSLSLLNRQRHQEIFAVEDWAAVALRSVAVVLGIAALAYCAVRCGTKE